MTCQHIGKDLVWEVAVPIPAAPEVTYKYAVVNEQLEVIKWESETHTISLPNGLEAGAIIDIFDQWQVLSKHFCNTQLLPATFTAHLCHLCSSCSSCAMS